LIYAVKRGSFHIVISLLSRGVDVDVHDIFGKSALMYAMMMFDSSAISALQLAGAELTLQDIETLRNEEGFEFPKNQVDEDEDAKLRIYQGIYQRIQAAPLEADVYDTNYPTQVVNNLDLQVPLQNNEIQDADGLDGLNPQRLEMDPIEADVYDTSPQQVPVYNYNNNNDRIFFNFTMNDTGEQN
jgi:hypothetical protein